MALLIFIFEMGVKEGNALAQNKFQSKGELNKEIDELHHSSLFLRLSKTVEHCVFLRPSCLAPDGL